MMNKSQLQQMRSVDITQVDPCTLVDIRTVYIDSSLPAAEKMRSYFAQVVNPYCFLCGDTPVPVSYTHLDIQSVEDYYLTHMEDIAPDSETVTISIRCDTVLDNWDKLDEQLRDEKYIPSDGVILPEATYVLRPGDTAFDVLQRACQYNQIQMEYQGAEPVSYTHLDVYKRQCQDFIDTNLRRF